MSTVEGGVPGCRAPAPVGEAPAETDCSLVKCSESSANLAKLLSRLVLEELELESET